jgi:hypothetical protein
VSRRLRSRARIGFVLFAASLGAACGDAPRQPPAPSSSLANDLDRTTGVLHAQCVEGSSETCSIELGRHAGILSCYEGKRSCRGGTFGPCTDGHSFELAAPETAAASASLHPLAFSAASDCVNNPCNRYCREFNEAPPEGVTPDPDPAAPPLSTWNSGNLADYPPEWVAAGNQEPCQSAGDCQFNTACNDPSFGSCGHSVCAASGPLAPGCNRCADLVCAVDATCCATPTECEHDPCEAGSGSPLTSTCDSCVAAVCGEHPECCTTSWNDACVAYVATDCAPLGQTCGCPDGSAAADGQCYLLATTASDSRLSRDGCDAVGSAWNLLEVKDADENDRALGLLTGAGVTTAWIGGLETDQDEWSWPSTSQVFFISDAMGGSLQNGYTYQNFGPGEPTLGKIGQNIVMASSGFWRSDVPSSQFPYLCEGPPNRLSPAQPATDWGARCVALAQSECGVVCPSDEPVGVGACTPRVVTEIDAACVSFDLALGATCEDAGTPMVPVCNHGRATAPAGLRLTHLPASEIGNLTPNLSEAVDCTLADPIPAGRCVTVSDCPGLTADRALVVNPIDGAQNDGECLLDDNWTIYQPVSCRSPMCEAGTYDAGRVASNSCKVALQNPLGLDLPNARVTLETTIPEPRCLLDEIRWGDSCYYFSNDILDWDNAETRCRARGPGWDLVALNSPAESAWVRGETVASKDVQIGLNDKLVEGTHTWSNGSCRVFDNWDPLTLQPNNLPPGSEQCARMTAAAGEGWEDTACNDGEHPYVCEGPLLDAVGGCQSGQIAGPDGSCYAYDPEPVSFTEAGDRCTALGLNWKLAVIDDSRTNDFVTGLLDCRGSWLQNPPGAYAHWAPSESVDLSNPPFVDSLGRWHATLDGTLRGTLCQGPQSASATPTLSQVPDANACANASQYYFDGSAASPDSLVLCPLACEAVSGTSGRHLDLEIPARRRSSPRSRPPALRCIMKPSAMDRRPNGTSCFMTP